MKLTDIMMFKNFIQGKDPKSVSAFLAISLFIFFSAMKITLFNCFLIPSPNLNMFRYKLGMTLLILVVLYPLLLRIKSKCLIIILYLLETAYILVNVSYYQYYRSYLQIMQWLSLFNEGLTAATHSSAPFSFRMLVVLIDLPFFLYIAIRFDVIYHARTGKHVQRSLIIMAAVIAIFSVEAVNLAQSQSVIQFANDRYRGEAFIVERYGTFINQLVGLASKSSQDRLISCLVYGRTLINEETREERPNFVVIQVESMDSNIISHKYRGSYIMPRLQALSRQNIYYPYVLSYHKGGSTSDAEFSIINSMEPLDGFPVLKLSNYSYPNSFLKCLNKGGYSTNAFHGNTGNFFGRDTAFPRMGFGSFLDMNSMKMKDQGWGCPDGDVFAFAYNVLLAQKRPFLSYIITMTSHGPFTNYRNYYRNSLFDSISDTLVRDYFNSMSYVDTAVGGIVEKIRSNFQNTYILIVGDHTPNISSTFYRQASISEDNTFLEFVPLIIITPEGKQYAEKQRAASFLDISPTILFRSGLAFNIKTEGADLISEGSVFNKIPFKGKEYDRGVLFDLITK